MKSRWTIIAIFSVLVMVIGVSGSFAANKTLKLVTYYKEGHSYFEGIKYFAKEVEARSKGRLKVEIYGGGSLIPPKEEFESVSKGTVDLAFSIVPYFAGKVPITGVVEMLGTVSFEKHLATVRELNPLIDVETSKHGVICFGSHINIPYVLSTRKPIKTREDLDRLLLRVPGGWLGKTCVAPGGKPVSMSVGEVAEALHRGTVDGAWLSAETTLHQKLYEVAPYITWDKISGWTIGAVLIMNKAAFDTLPKDIQKIINGSYQDAMKYSIAGPLKKSNAEIMDKLRNVATVYILSKEESKRWGAEIGKVYKAFTEETGEQGRKAMEIVVKYKK